MRINLGQRMIDLVRGKEKFPSFIHALTFGFNHSRKHKKNNSIIILGDSHVNFFSGNEYISFSQVIKFKDGINSCMDKLSEYTTFHIGPALAYNINKYGSETNAREKVEHLIANNYFNESATILCCFGEIDIRVHVLKQAEKQNTNYKEIVSNIVTNYIEFLVFLKEKGYRVFCWGAIPSQKDSAHIDPHYPRYGDEKSRNKATKFFNDEMKRECKSKGIGFISIFDEMISNDFETTSDYLSDDTCHLSQSAMKIAKNKLVVLN